jgi:hypothetical protein
MAEIIGNRMVACQEVFGTAFRRGTVADQPTKIGFDNLGGKT